MPRAGGSRAAGTEEAWLRGNVRPVLGGGSVLVGGALVATGLAAAWGAASSLVWALAGATALVAAVVVALGRLAAGVRVGRRGAALVVRLSPWRTETVPLGAVECVFPGSRPLDGPRLRHAHAADEDAIAPSGRRVGTLVIRFAERAVEWRERPTFAPWGTWHDGHAIVDGRWCEPLSAAVARTISERLLEAKREAAAAEAGR